MAQTCRVGVLARQPGGRTWHKWPGARTAGCAEVELTTDEEQYLLLTYDRHLRVTVSVGPHRECNGASPKGVE